VLVKVRLVLASLRPNGVQGHSTFTEAGSVLNKSVKIYWLVGPQRSEKASPKEARLFGQTPRYGTDSSRFTVVSLRVPEDLSFKRSE
jgi:hypothetical protein